MVEKHTLRCFALLLFLLQFINFKILTLVCSLFQAFQSNERHSSGSKTNIYLKYSQKGRLQSDQAKHDRRTCLSKSAIPISQETLPLPAVETWMDRGKEPRNVQEKSMCQAASGERSLPFSEEKPHGLGSARFHAPLNSLFKVLSPFPCGTVQHTLCWSCLLATRRLWFVSPYIITQLNQTCVSIGCYI